MTPSSSRSRSTILLGSIFGVVSSLLLLLLLLVVLLSSSIAFFSVEASECWVNSGRSTWIVNTQVTTKEFSEARATCDSLGAFLPRVRQDFSSTSSSLGISQYWSGLIVLPNTNGDRFYFHSGATPPANLTDETASAWTADNATNCWYYPGGASAKFQPTVCSGAASAIPVICEVPIETDAPTQWQPISQNGVPYIAAMVIPYRGTRANVVTECAAYGGDPAFVPNSTWATTNYLPIVKAWKYSTYTADATAAAYCTSVGMSGLLAADQSFYGPAPTATASYIAYFGSAAGPVSPYTSMGLNGYRMWWASGDSFQHQYPVSAGQSYSYLCSRMIDQISVGLTSLTCNVNDTASAKVYITLQWKPPRAITLNIYSTARARPVYSSVTFAAGTSTLTQYVDILCISGGGGLKATFNVSLDAASDRWALGRDVTWQTSNQITINIPTSPSNYVAFNPSSSIKIRTGEFTTTDIKFPAGSQALGQQTFAVTKQSLAACPCVQYASSATFSNGDTTKSVSIVSSSMPCTSCSLVYTLISQTDIYSPYDGFTLALSVTVVPKVQITRVGSGTVNIYDGGYSNGTTAIRFSVNSTNTGFANSNYGTFTWNVSTCVGAIVVSASNTQIGDDADHYFYVYSNEITVAQRSCKIIFYVNSSDSDMYGNDVFYFDTPGTKSYTVDIAITQYININATDFPFIWNETTTPTLYIDYEPKYNEFSPTITGVRFGITCGNSNVHTYFLSNGYAVNNPGANLQMVFDSALGTGWIQTTMKVDTGMDKGWQLRPAAFQYGLPNTIIYKKNQARLPRFRIFPLRLYTNNTFYVNITTNTPINSGMFKIITNCTGVACRTTGDVVTYDKNDWTATIGDWVTFPTSVLSTGATPGSMKISIRENDNVGAGSSISMAQPDTDDRYSYTINVLPQASITYNFSTAGVTGNAVVYRRSNDPLVLWVGEGNPIETGTVTVTAELANSSCASITPANITLEKTRGAQAFFIYASDDYNCIHNSVTLTQNSTDPSHLADATFTAYFSVEPKFRINIDFASGQATTFDTPRSANIVVKVNVSLQDVADFPVVQTASQVFSNLKVYVAPYYPPPSDTSSPTYTCSPSFATITDPSDYTVLACTITDTIVTPLIFTVKRIVEIYTGSSGGNSERRFTVNKQLMVTPKPNYAVMRMVLSPTSPYVGKGLWSGQSTQNVEVVVENAADLSDNSTITLTTNSGSATFATSTITVVGNLSMTTLLAPITIATITSPANITITASLANAAGGGNYYLAQTATVSAFLLPQQAFSSVTGWEPFPDAIFPFDRAIINFAVAPNMKATSNYPRINITQITSDTIENLRSLPVTTPAGLNPFTIDPTQSNTAKEVSFGGLNFTTNQTITATINQAGSSPGSISVALPQSLSFNILARERMIPYLKNLPSEIYVGSANNVTIYAITGPGFADVTFQIKIIDESNQGTLTASEFVSPTSFTVKAAGNDPNGYSVPVPITFSGPRAYDNVSVWIYPQTTTAYHVDPKDLWAQNYFIQPPKGPRCEILGLRGWNMTIDSTVLWGPRDYITVTFNLKSPARTGWDVQTTVQVNGTLLNESAILDTSNATFYANFQNADQITTKVLIIKGDASFDWATKFPLPNISSIVFLQPYILDWIAAKYDPLTKVNFTMSRSRTWWVKDVDPYGTLFLGDRGKKNIVVGISDLPKAGRMLVLNISCNVTHSNITITPQQLFWWPSNSSLSAIVTVATVEGSNTNVYLNFTVVVDETVTTAVEFLPADLPQPNIVLVTKDVISIDVTKNWIGTYIPSTSTTRVLSFSTQNMYLTNGDYATVKLVSSLPSVLSLVPWWNVTFVGGDTTNGTSNRTLNPSGLGATANPTLVQLQFPYFAPIKYFPGPTNLNFTVFNPRPINITRWARRSSAPQIQSAETRKYYINADFGAYYVKVDIPDPYDTYSPRAVTLDISCNTTCVQFYPYVGSGPWSTNIVFNNANSWSRIINFTAVTNQYCHCNFTFASTAPYMTEEFTSSMQTIVFKGYDRVPLRGTLRRAISDSTEETMMMYESEAQQLNLFTVEVLRDICENGDTVIFNVTANATTTFSKNAVFKSDTALLSNLPYNDVQDITVATAGYVNYQAILTNQDCYAIQPSTFSLTIQIVKKVPIYLFRQPTRAYIDNTTYSYLTFTPPSTVPIPSGATITINMWFDGPAGSIDIGNNRTGRPEKITSISKYKNWTLVMPIPPNGTTTTIPFNVTGVQFLTNTEYNISCEPDPNTGARFAFSGCVVVYPSVVRAVPTDEWTGIKVPQLFTGTNYSNSVELDTALHNAGTNIISSAAVLAELLVGENRYIDFTFASDDCDVINPQVQLSTDSRFITLGSPSIITSTTYIRKYRVTVAVVNSSYDWLLPSTDPQTKGGFVLQIQIIQNARRFFYMNNIRIVTFFVPVVSILPGAPTNLRVNRVNALNFTLGLDRPPRRRSVNLTLSSITNLVFEPTFVVWNVDEAPNVTITMWGNATYNNASVLFAFDIPEMTAFYNSTDLYRVKIMPLGALQVRGMIDVLFEGQLNLIQLQPDFQPLSQPLEVTVQYSHGTIGEYVEVVRLVDNPNWYPDTTGFDRVVTMEVSAGTSTNGVSYEMLYNWNSTEYDRVECLPTGDGSYCKRLAVNAQPIIEVMPQTGLEIVLFPGESYTFNVRASKCTGATVQGVLSLPEYPTAVVFNPNSVTFTCTSDTSALANVTVTAQPYSGTGDATPRATAIGAEVRTTLANVPPSNSKLQLKANVAVYSPAMLTMWLSSNITYTGSYLNFTIKLPRKPAKGIVNALLTVEGGVAQSQFVWNPAVEIYSSFPELLTKTVTIAIPQDRPAGLVNISVALSGVSAGEYLMNQTVFRAEVRRPEFLFAYTAAQPRRFVLEKYNIWVAVQEKPEVNTSISVFVNATVWQPRVNRTDPLVPLPGGTAAAVRWLSSDTITFLDNATELNISTQFQVIAPCIITFSFTVFPERRQFNKTLIPNDVLQTELVFSRNDEPVVKQRPTESQFVLEINTQTFSVKVDFLPLAGYLRFYPVMKTVRLDGKPYTGDQLPVLFAPSEPVTIYPTSRETESVFFIWNNTATPDDLTTEVWIHFDNTSTGQFNLTALYVGKVHFVALHTVLPLTLVKGLENSLFISYEGISFEVPCVVTGLPPINTTYEIKIEGQTQNLDIKPNTVSFYQNDTEAIRINSTDNTKVYYKKMFTITGTRRSQNIVRFASLTKLAVAPMFDAGEVSFRVTVVSPLAPILNRLGPEFGGNGNGGALDPIPMTAVTAYVGDVNAQLYQITMMDKDPTTSEIKIVVSTTAGTDIVALNPSEFSFKSTDTYPVVRAFSLRCLKRGNSSVSHFNLTFKIAGSNMYANKVEFPLTVIDQHTFSFSGLPITIFAGTGNAVTIPIAPAVSPPSPLFLVLSVGCSEVTVSPVNILFNGTLVPKLVTITGLSKSNPCLLTASQDPLRPSPTFVKSSILSLTQSDTITVNPAPELIPDLYIGGSTTSTSQITAADLRNGNIVLTLSLISDSKSEFVPTSNLTIDFRNESSITLTSTRSVTAAPNGVHASFSQGLLRTSAEVRAGAASITLTLMKTPSFTIYESEVISFRLNANAIVNRTAPNPNAAPPQLTILPDEKQPPRRSTRVPTASVAVSASFLSGLASATAASQAGYLLAAASVADCPSTTWMDQMQNSMPAYMAPIPLDFGISTAELGRFAGGLVGNFLCIAIWAGVHFGLVLVLKRLRGLRTYDKPSSLMRFPGLVWLPIMLLLQPTVCLAALLVLYSSRTDFKLLGSFGIVATVVVVPFFAFRIHTQSADLEYEDPPTKGTFITRFLKRGTYDHPDKPYWVGQFGFPLQALRMIRRWYFMLEIATLVILGFIAALQPKEVKDCIMRAAAMIIILMLHLILVIVVKPYSALLDTVFWSLGYILQIVAISFVLNAQLRGGGIDNVSSAYDTAGSILSVFAAIFMIYGLISLCYLVAEVLQKCEDPRDAGSKRKQKMSSNIQRFAEELKRMELNGDTVQLGPGGSSAAARNDDDDDDDDDDDEHGNGSSGDDDDSDGGGDDAASRRRRRRRREREERTGMRNISAAVRLSVTAIPGDKKHGTAPRYGFQRAFDPTVMALDGGNYDAKERDRRMAEEARGVRETMMMEKQKNSKNTIDSTNYDDYASYFDDDDNGASSVSMAGTTSDPYKRSKKPTISISSKKASDGVASTPGFNVGDYFSSSTSGGGDACYTPPKQRSQKEILAALGSISREEAGHL